MLDAYFVGAIVCACIGIVIMVIGIIALTEESDAEARKSLHALAVVFLGTLTLPWIWPLVVAGGLLFLIGWSLFTTARVIRHRSVDF